MQKLAVYWSRRDFRLADNPALFEAAEKARTEGIPLLPLFVLEDYMCTDDPRFQFGYPSRYFLAHALPLFAKRFPHFSVLKGKGAESIVSLAAHYNVEVYVNEDVYPDFYKQVKKLTRAGVVVHVFKDQLTVDRATKTGTGKHYSVFTPFKKAVWESFVQTKPCPTPDFSEVSFYALPPEIPRQDTIAPTLEALTAAFPQTRSCMAGDTVISIDALHAEKPKLDLWYTSESEALSRFDSFLKEGMSGYKDNRDTLAKRGTSQMSLALAWGLLSARTLVSATQVHFGESLKNPFSSSADHGAVHFISELIWREFYKYLFFHNPALMYEEFQERFRGKVQWVAPEVAHQRLLLWIQGRTGYKVVDAAMLELAHTGWMHNRARMIVASVLTKNLGVPWQWGQEYFRAMLIDLDEASNNGGWQWGASVGADPKPIRIFNPYLQAENYDKEGAYQKKWLGADRFLSEVEPIVPHKEARATALARYGLSEKRDGFARDF